MRIRPADCVFVLCAALFCLAALAGTKLILPDGVCMDSDLQNYTQILASWLSPGLTRGDPLYPTYALYPGIPNLFMSMAHWFAYDGNAAYGIFRAGAVTIFLHLVCFYALGRWLFRSAGLSALFSLCMSITFYWSFGTFWGATHSEPVPRVLYAGLFYPLWLFLGTLAFRRVWLRPVLLFGIGLSVQVHSLSAITCAAMFLMAFLLTPRRLPFGRHILTVVLCAAAFALPALPLVISHMGSMAGKLSSADLEMISQCWTLLAEKDWAAPWNSLGRALLRYTFPAAFLPLGLAAWFVTKRMSWRLTPEAHYLLGLLPGFLLGIAGMLALCFVEMNFAGRMGYKYRAAMALQRTYDDTAILDEFILEVENEGRLRFGPGAEGVRPAEPQDAAPDLVLPPLDAARLLFGPDSPLVPGAQAVPAGLLPLPLAFPWADGI